MRTAEQRVAGRTAGGSTAARRRRVRPEVRLLVVGVLAAATSACFLLLFIRGGASFAIERRAVILGAMLVAAFAQGVGTVLFHTVTANRILTPSIMGFDSLYVLMQTLVVWFFGGRALADTDGVPRLVVQTLLMVGFATILYRWLFSGRFADLTALLLVGVVLGLAFESVSVFLQRLLAPADYDLLATRLFGRFSTVDAAALPLALAVCAVVGVVVWRRRARLDVLLLGREQATTLGLGYTRELTMLLVVIALLIAFSTALVGPLTFFGFLVALLAYQFAGTHRHAVVLPMAVLLGVLALTGGQFLLEHVLRAAGFLNVIIEFAGGIVFLIVLLRKGAL